MRKRADLPNFIFFSRKIPEKVLTFEKKCVIIKKEVHAAFEGTILACYNPNNLSHANSKRNQHGIPRSGHSAFARF